MSSNRINFLKSVCNPDLENETIEIRLQGKTGRMESFFSSDLKKINEKIEEQKQDKNVYFGIAPRKNKDSGTKENCSSISTLWIDIDCGTDGHNKASSFETKQIALDHINQMSLKPSITLDSGHGLHCYLLLKEKLPLNDQNIQLIEDLNKVLIYMFDGDKSCYNVDRILRVPETLNIKTDSFAEVKIIQEDSGIKYSISELLDNPLVKLNWDRLKNLKIKNVPVLDLLYGNNIEALEKESNSEADQSIITALLSNGFSKEEVELLFKYFPTSGKYHSHPSPEQYLSKSIKNAQKYIENNLQEVILENSNTTTGNYESVETPDQFGYINFQGYLLSNFIVKIDEIVQKTRNGVFKSVFNGRILLKDELKYFKNIETDIFVENKKFKKFIMEYLPTKSEFYGNISEIIEAVRFCNKDVAPIDEIEFGFNVELTEYKTDSLIINKNGIFDAKHFIRNSDQMNTMQLHLDKVDDLQYLETIKNQIVNVLFQWDTPDVIFNALAFAFLPIIYPFLKSIQKSKPYLYLKGSSGSGKSLLSLFVQRFFVQLDELISCTSTSAALNIIGAGFKDALCVIDDLKFENFKNEKELKNFMALIQNYADGSERKKSTRTSSLQDSSPINAILLLNGEDLIISESSSIARGIIINVYDKDIDYKKSDLLSDLSQSFSGLTPHYINYILARITKEEIITTYKLNRKWFQHRSIRYGKTKVSNLPRVINNFAMVKTSFDIFINFLCNDNNQAANYKSAYENSIIDVFLKTLDRVDDSKNDMKFESALWNLIEAEKLYLEKIDNTGKESFPSYYKGTKIGYYLVSNSMAKICIN